MATSAKRAVGAATARRTSVARPSDGPYVAPKVNRPSHSRRALCAAELADRKAVERLRWVRHVLDVAPNAAPSTAYLELAHAFREGGALAGGHCPPRNTFLAWFARGQAARAAGEPLTAELFRDKERPGRRPVEVAPEVRDLIERRWKGGHERSIHSLHRRLLITESVAHCDIPGVEVLRRIVASIPLLEVAAARHGRRAAVIDHALKSTIPTRFAHDVWTLDETELPIYVRAFNPASRTEEVVKPHVVVVADHHTKVIVGYQLVPAFGDTADGLGTRTSATAIEADILAAVWSAALRDLAPACTAPFAGHLPRAVRMDNIASHGAARQLLLSIGVEVPPLPPYVPNARGDIERLIQTFQKSLPDVQGLTSRFFIADHAREHPGYRRSRNVGVGRTSVRAPIALADLLTLEQLRPELERVIQKFHESPHAGLGELTPQHAYHQHQPPTVARRAGADVLRVAERRVVTMRPAGVVVNRQRFRTVDAADMPAMGATCQVVIDPIRRGAWWMDVTPPRFLPTVVDAARSPQILEQHVLAQATASQASDDADFARRAHLVELTGDPNAPARADAAMERAFEQIKEAKKAAREAKRVARAAARPKAATPAKAKRAPAVVRETTDQPTITVRPAPPVRLPEPIAGFSKFPDPRIRS